MYDIDTVPVVLPHLISHDHLVVGSFGGSHLGLGCRIPGKLRYCITRTPSFVAGCRTSTSKPLPFSYPTRHTAAHLTSSQASEFPVVWSGLALCRANHLQSHSSCSGSRTASSTLSGFLRCVISPVRSYGLSRASP
jgi:hypothetical protein